jgi:cytochrome P450
MTEVTLTRYADVQQVFRRKSFKQALYDEGGVVMRDVLLTLHGDEHRARRRLENRMFRREVFQHYDRHLVPQLIDDTLKPFVAAGRADLLPIGHRTTLHLTALVSGIDRPLGTTEETEALYAFDLKFSEGATLVHSTRDHDEVRAEVAAALEAFDAEFLQPSIERRRSLLAQLAAGEIGEEDLPKDVLTVLLRNADDLALPPDVVLREIAFFLQAGSHSSANAFAHAMDDLFGWFDQHPEDRRRALDDRLFLQRCVHESLRLNPASPVAWRTALEDVHLRGDLAVEAGTKVILDLRSANRDPEVFGDDAAQFNPYRPEPQDVPRWGHTFGGGMHVCIGMDLDGGTIPVRMRGDDDTVVVGVVPQMVEAMLVHGARRDPEHPPQWDALSQRPHFSSYPVVFGEP